MPSYDYHRVYDRASGGMYQDVQDGDVDEAVDKLVMFLRRNDPERPVDLYEEKATHSVEWRDLPDPREEARDDA